MPDNYNPKPLVNTPESTSIPLEKSDPQIEKSIALLQRCIAGWRFDDAKKILDLNILPEESFKKPEIIATLEQKLLYGWRFDDAKKILDLNILPEESFNNPEIIAAFEQKLLYCIKSIKYFTKMDFDYRDLKKILDLNILPEESFKKPEIIAALEQKLITNLSKSYLNSVEEVRNLNILPEESFKKPEIIAAFEEGFINEFSTTGSYTGRVLEEVLNLNFLSEESFKKSEISTAIQRVLIDIVLYRGDNYRFQQIRNLNILPEESFNNPEIIAAFEQKLIKHFSEGDTDKIREIVNLNILPEESFKKPEIITAFEKLLSYAFFDGNTDYLYKVLDLGILPENLVKKMLLNNDRIQKSVKNWTEHFPNIAAKQDTIMGMLWLYDNQENLDRLIFLKQKYPWIEVSFEGNDRFSDKLLLKLPELDSPSLQNINFLYTQKQEIVKKLPGIDTNSAEYRNHVQQELLSYQNNEVILNRIQASGVHVESWLQYNSEQSFMLGKADITSFAEMVKTPVERISETLDNYKTSFRKVFGEYQKELQAFRIPLESIADIQKEVDAMQVRINQVIQEGQAGKAQGMQKGLESLRQRLENPKTAPLWQKMTGDFDAIARVGGDVEKAHAKLVDSEKDYQQILQQEDLSKEDRQKAFEQKKIIAGLLKEFSEKLNLLELRMKQFTESVKIMTEPCLGADRTTALVQELNDYTFEALDHFTADVTSSRGALEQKLSLDEDAGSKLEGRFLKIGVWGRNPDRDLYLGNYTDCCIRIDSDHMGEESTIADYLTDLGIQVITVTDEVTDEPIVAAWTYIGHKNAKPKMVIDNIEANRDYSHYFPTIKSQLEEYFKNYAAAVNIAESDISQGENNNDIILNVEVGDYYYKMGGYNRINGYYLEAEPYETGDEENSDQYFDEDYEDYEDYDNDEDDEEDSYEEDDNNEEYDDGIELDIPTEDSLENILSNNSRERLEKIRNQLG